MKKHRLEPQHGLAIKSAARTSREYEVWFPIAYYGLMAVVVIGVIAAAFYSDYS